MINKMTIATLNHPSPKGDKPNKGDTNSQKQTIEPISVIKMRRFEIKAVPLEIAKHFFDTHSLFVITDQAFFASTITNEKPRFVFLNFPMKDKPKPSSIVFFGQTNPTDIASLSRF